MEDGISTVVRGEQRTMRRAYDAFISYSHAADMALAAAVQKALQVLARPWYRRRALRVFRDESNLSAAPDLWGRIASAVAQSGAFILMASPEAADSRWGTQEVLEWRKSNGTDRLFIAVTSGDIMWDDGHSDFDWVYQLSPARAPGFVRWSAVGWRVRDTRVLRARPPEGK